MVKTFKMINKDEDEQIKKNDITWSIRPPSKFRLFLRKLNGFWHKVILRNIWLFKRWKQPKINTNLTLGYLAHKNTYSMSDEEKNKLNKEHGRIIKPKVNLFEEVCKNLDKEQ